MGILLAAVITIAAAQQAVDLTRIGPQVGQQAPAFTLSDQNGRQASLESVMGPKGAMIVFFHLQGSRES